MSNTQSHSNCATSRRLPKSQRRITRLPCFPSRSTYSRPSYGKAEPNQKRFAHCFMPRGLIAFGLQLCFATFSNCSPGKGGSNAKYPARLSKVPPILLGISICHGLLGQKGVHAAAWAGDGGGHVSSRNLYTACCV